jgi:hypothetical protein
MKTPRDCKHATAELMTLLNDCEIAESLLVKRQLQTVKNGGGKAGSTGCVLWGDVALLQAIKVDGDQKCLEAVTEGVYNRSREACNKQTLSLLALDHCGAEMRCTPAQQIKQN